VLDGPLDAQSAVCHWLQSSSVSTSAPRRLRALQARLVELCPAAKRSVLAEQFDSVTDVRTCETTGEAGIAFCYARRREQQQQRSACRPRASSPMSPMRSLEPRVSSPLRGMA